MNKKLALAAVAALVLTACGGGGGGGGGGTASNVAGLWNGTTSTGRSVSALTFQDGTVWALYSPIGNPGYIAGAVQANGSVSGATIAGTGADYNLEGGGITAGTITATVNPKTSISGGVTAGSTITFSGTYSSAFEQTPSLSALAGTFTGTGVVSGGSESATVTLAASGALTGSSASGCTFTGTAAPRTDGNAFNLTVTFGGGPCALGTQAVTGIAYFDASERRVYGAALNSAKTNGFIFSGTKP